jgi:glycine cleavage system transcriptional repressor
VYARAVRSLAVSAIGRDRPGIVAAVTGVLLRHGVNVEDTQMTILRGHFTMMLFLAAPDELDPATLERDLSEPETGLEELSVAELEEFGPGPEPTHTVTVYGSDHPGIVHAAASALAEREIDITDLNSRLVDEDDGQALYVLMMEVALPAGASADELDAALDEVAGREGVEVTLHELERDEL